MKLAVISFTRAGGQVCASLVKQARELGMDCQGYMMDRFFHTLQDGDGICPVRETVAEWTRNQFGQADGLVYIGAAGIAVRSVAPCLKDKMTDPAVVVVDEQKRYVVSLLSGHVGGANELTLTIAGILGAEPVITTASDVCRKTAIDVWAKKRGLRLSDRTLAKQVAASLLDGEMVGFFSDYPLDEPIPDGFCKGDACRLNVWVTSKRRPKKADAISWFLPEKAEILRLIPPVLFIGVGCRKGTGKNQILQLVSDVLAQENLEPGAVAGIASIDIKKEEKGIVEAAKELGVPFYTFPAAVLEAVHGVFTSSEFVKGVTGTDNVCERSALAAAGEGGRLLVKKQVAAGVTAAVAEAYREMTIDRYKKEKGRHELISDNPGR